LSKNKSIKIILVSKRKQVLKKSMLTLYFTIEN